MPCLFLTRLNERRTWAHAFRLRPEARLNRTQCRELLMRGYLAHLPPHSVRLMVGPSWYDRHVRP